MSDTDQTTYLDEQVETSDIQSQVGAHGEAATQSQTGAQTTAAERLGGPSETDNGDKGGAHASSAQAQAQAAAGSSDHANAALIAADKAESYRGRWNELKGEFVDEPRTAVRGANELVGEVLDELENLFRRQRDELEGGLDSDDTSTEDLRQALGKYRSFFDRLLSV